MTVSIIALTVLLVCILFIRSTVIKPRYGREEGRPSKVNAIFCLVCAILSFIPYVKWVLMVAAPILTLIWFCSNGFDDNNERRVEISDKTIIGKILLFKI